MRRTASKASPESQLDGWTDEELSKLEAGHPQGISTQQVVELMASRGASLGEATFRKYVQLGLLPRSVRVGRKGKHRGSQGLYPATVVRQIELIRRLMAQGHTIQEIQRDFLFLGSDIDEAARQLKQLLERVEEAAAERTAGEPVDEVVARAIADARSISEDLVERLRAVERRLAMRRRMARAAV